MSRENEKLKTYRILILGLGTFLAAFFILAFLPKLFGAGTAPAHQSGREWEGQVMTATFFVFLAGYAIGWWLRLWGGIIMILSAFIVSIPFIVLDSNYGSLIFGIPEAFTGILYVLLYWTEKRLKIQNK